MKTLFKRLIAIYLINKAVPFVENTISTWASSKKKRTSGGWGRFFTSRKKKKDESSGLGKVVRMGRLTWKALAS